MSMFGCFFGHKWTKWGEAQVEDMISYRGIKYRGSVQYRTCSRCGLIGSSGI